MEIVLLSLYLGLFVEVGTIGITIKILSSIAGSIIYDLAEKGYTIKISSLGEYIRKRNEKESNLKKKMRKISLFLPIVNIAVLYNYGKKVEKDVLNSSEIKEKLISLSENQKQKLNQAKNITQKKLLCLDYQNNINDDYVYTSGETIVKDNYYLKYKSLPLTYSLEEIKKLNRVTNNFYRIGHVEGSYVAIIGVPYEKYSDNLGRIIIQKGKNELSFSPFYHLTEEEVNDQKFIVYPYMNELSDDKILQNCHNEIIKNRYNDIDFYEDKEDCYLEDKMYKPKKLVKTPNYTGGMKEATGGVNDEK